VPVAARAPLHLPPRPPFRGRHTAHPVPDHPVKCEIVKYEQLVWWWSPRGLDTGIWWALKGQCSRT
jgi:hypothetical protein